MGYLPYFHVKEVGSALWFIGKVTPIINGLEDKKFLDCIEEMEVLDQPVVVLRKPKGEYITKLRDFSGFIRKYIPKEDIKKAYLDKGLKLNAESINQRTDLSILSLYAKHDKYLEQRLTQFYDLLNMQTPVGHSDTSLNGPPAYPLEDIVSIGKGALLTGFLDTICFGIKERDNVFLVDNGNIQRLVTPRIPGILPNPLGIYSNEDVKKLTKEKPYCDILDWIVLNMFGITNDCTLQTCMKDINDIRSYSKESPLRQAYLSPG